MRFFGSYSFLAILSESIKLLPKNGKLMAFVAIFPMILYSSFVWLLIFSMDSLMSHMFVTSQQFVTPDPGSFDPNSFSPANRSSFTPKTDFTPDQIKGMLDNLKEFFAILLAVEIAFFLAFSIVFFFSTVSTILVSAISYGAQSLSLKELFLMIWRTRTRPLITSFYIFGLVAVYSVTVVILAGPLLMYPNLSSFWVAIFVGIPAFIFYLYLVVPWALSLVVSVVENCYGMEALEKAAALVRGKRLHGFLLNISLSLVLLIIFQGYKMILGNYAFATISLMLLVSVTSLVTIFLVVAYTVLYFHCKMHHEEKEV